MVSLPVFKRYKRAREGVAILLNDVWHSAVMDFLGVLALESSGLYKGFQELKFVRWWVTEPMKEMVKKSQRFWNDLDKIVDRVKNACWQT